MKLAIVGSSGFVGKELVRQAISSPAVSSVVGLARRETPVPENLSNPADAAKLTSVVCDDFLHYSENVKQQLSNADACIWLMAVTPSKSRTVAWEEVRKVCLDYTVAGLETLSRLPRNNTANPLRFIYISGVKSERDQTKKPLLLGDYCLLRGEVESRVLDFAKNSNGTVEACIGKPGIIQDSQRMNVVTSTFQNIAAGIISLPTISLSDLAAALLNQLTKGFEKETLENDDLARIGKAELAEGEESSEK
ncbi:hypothetical protein Trco_001039 [Trichoderma cornu-damae]|uniref:NAD(P)-binding domain-containing protein n=1 Tax=Trichoderma cornu-damae TaxID=654480 RepID=A0A9P8U0W4_9HYPO|nr:hypothetical protein Trco_001039 [Trichoderma cornu-damae]